MKKLGVRAWKVKGFDGTGIAFSESRGGAKMIVARTLHEMCGCTMSDALTNLNVRLAKEYDNATYCGKKPNKNTSYNPKYLVKEDTV